MAKKKKSNKDKFYPDANEPHVHIHKGGITFTDVGHNHRYIVRGNLVYFGARNEVMIDLRGRNDTRATNIADWIRDNT